MSSESKPDEVKHGSEGKAHGDMLEKLSGIGYLTLIKYTVLAMMLVSPVVFAVLFKSLMDSPLVLGTVTLLFLLGLHFSNIFKKLGELTFEAIIVIILTILFIQVSYPFFSPKVDIISSNIVKGYSDDTGDYVFEIFSATVKKPMIMACGSLCGPYCTDISFFNGVWGEVNGPEVNITKMGSRRVICTYGNFDMMTRLLKFNAAYPQPLDYEFSGLNLTLASYNATANRFVFTSDISNNLPFPLTLKYRTLTFSINDMTRVPSPADGKPVSLYDLITSAYQRNGCPADGMGRQVSNSFRISDSPNVEMGGVIRGYANSARINDGMRTIDLDMKVSGTLQQESKYVLYVIYEPSSCLK